MDQPTIKWRRAARAAAVIALTSLVGACAWNTTAPAPVEQRDGMPEAAPSPFIPPPPPRVESRRIVVRPSQSLRGIAHAYHVSERALIAANHLRPPYKIEIGQRLLIPGGGDGGIRPGTLPPVTMTPLPPLGGAASGGRSGDVIPLDEPGPARPSGPASVPLDAPRGPIPLTPPGPASEARPLSGSSAAEEARREASAAPPASPAPVGGRFPWPVRGHVLAGYGVVSGGAHNDGINIAAPRGAPIAAVDGGEVAYAGNELRGYGNLVLIKHANGFITAYAHCDELLVHKGEHVSRGQIIAKVGTTGGVNEPQLHFELRRGKQPVDPKEFLAPAPAA
ncbi:MAG: M23 family metallopeptidase [Alphaproteobacteria bacterium]|nr:M23 family metallopeptidase [Alphaproteobacteria bacterium]